MAIRLDSFYVDYESKIVNNSKLLLQNIQKDQKSSKQLGDQEEDDSIQQFKDEYDVDLSQEFQEENENDNEEEEKQDKFDDLNDQPFLTIENYMTNQQNTQGQESKQQKKSSFFNIQVIGDENDKISINEDLENDRAHHHNLKSPVIVSLNNSKINLSSRKPQLNHLKVPSQTRLEGQKSKFSSFQQINKSMLEDDNVLGEDNIMDTKSVYSNNKDHDIKSIDQEVIPPKSYKKQDDELSKSSYVESPIHIKLKKDPPSSQKISANNIQRERLNSKEINKQFEENQKKMSQRKLQIQAQRSNVSQENVSPLQINPSPSSQSKDQKNDLILLSKLVQEKKNLIPQLSLISKIPSSNIQSQHYSQRDDSISQKVSNIPTENKMDQKDEVLKPEQIEVVEEKVEVIEEQKDNYEVQIKWNQVLGKNSRKVLLQGLIYEIEEKNDKLQSLQVDFSRFEQLTDDEATSFLASLQKSYKSLKQLHLNFFNNSLLTSNYLNLLLEKLAEQQKRCFLFLKNLVGLVDLNLKVDTAKVNGKLIQNLIINQSKTLIKLNLTLGRNIIFTNYTADKIIFDIAKCKRLQQIQISIAADQEFQNHKKLKLKKIQQISLISNEISYNRFFHNQNLNQIVKKLEEQTFNNLQQSTLKIRIIQNNQQFSPESFTGLLNFIKKFDYLQKLTLNMGHRNMQKNQNIEELVEALANLKFLQDLNLNFEQYSITNYQATLPFLKLKDAKIFMKNVIIFSYNGFSFDYIKKYLKSIKISDQVKIFGFKIPQIFSIDNQVVKLVTAYFYKNTIENAEIDTSQFDIKRYMNFVDVQIKGSQILIDKVIQTIVHQGEKMEELRLSYKNQSKIDSLDKSLALVHKLKNLNHVEIVQDGWVDMKWIESLLNQFKLIVNIKQIFISNPQIEVKFHEENLLIYSNTQSSLEKVLDFFDDHQDFFQRIKNIMISAYHKILYNENLRLRISNILLTTKIIIQIVVEHINIENFDQVYQVSDNTFDSDKISISSESVTTLIINSQYQQLGTKNQRIICNSFAQFENLQKLTIDLSYCNIHKQGIQILNNSLQLAALLTHLWIDLSFTNLEDNGIVEMVESIKQITLIQVIMVKLRYTNMKNEGSNTVLSLLNSFEDLQEIELDLSGNNISFEGLKYFEQIQKELPKIKRIIIDLKEDIIGDEGVLILKQIFNPLILPNVEYIDLNLNLSKLKINGISGILSSISNLKTLKHLDLNLSKNYIEDDQTQNLQFLTSSLQFIQNLKIVY
ncbi:hypothetical protein ABPG74_019482 [Tetrahymena malaccensis]